MAFPAGSLGWDPGGNLNPLSRAVAFWPFQARVKPLLERHRFYIYTPFWYPQIFKIPFADFLGYYTIKIRIALLFCWAIHWPLPICIKLSNIISVLKHCIWYFFLSIVNLSTYYIIVSLYGYYPNGQNIWHVLFLIYLMQILGYSFCCCLCIAYY